MWVGQPEVSTKFCFLKDSFRAFWGRHSHSCSKAGFCPTCSWLTTVVRSVRGTSWLGSLATAMVFKGTGKTPVEPEVAILRIWIPLTSCNLKSLEKVCADVISGAMEKILKVKVPVPMPTKTLRFTIRKTSCGKGSKTWDHFQLFLVPLSPLPNPLQYPVELVYYLPSSFNFTF